MNKITIVLLIVGAFALINCRSSKHVKKEHSANRQEKDNDATNFKEWASEEWRLTNSDSDNLREEDAFEEEDRQGYQEPPRNPNCSHGFEYLSSSNRCYKFDVGSFSWYEADKRCKSFDPRAHLVAVNDADEQIVATDFIKKKIGTSNICDPNGVWTSGQRMHPEDPRYLFVWRYRPGNLGLLIYTNFAPQQPSNDCQTEACLHFSFKDPEWRWNDLACDQSNACNGTKIAFPCGMCEIDLYLTKY